MKRLLLIRHGEIHARWRGRCYGRSDVGLSSRGHAQHRRAVSRLVGEGADVVYSSDLRRAHHLAEGLAHRIGRPLILSRDLRERDFGTWERISWDEIHATTGNSMDGMISAPDVWKPPGGETTFEMRDRVLGWYEQLPDPGTVVAVTHGGPIAALLGTLRGLPVNEWLELIPPWGQVVEARELGP